MKIYVTVYWDAGVADVQRSRPNPFHIQEFEAT